LVNINNFYIKNSGTDNSCFGIKIDSNYCSIINNNIKNNRNGIILGDSTNYNKIYYNNFIENYNNVFDFGNNNQWNNENPIGGNYWDDYTGSDNNGDGIGDTPYTISGGNSEDKYPFIKPIGWTNTLPNKPTIYGPPTGVPGIEYEYTFVSTDPDGDDLSYSIEWGDGNQDIIGEFPSGTPANNSHIWSDKGNYIIKVKAIDKYGGESEWGQFTVKIPRYNSIFSYLLLRFLKMI
jgi:parallel beta-helix repeat protein